MSTLWTSCRKTTGRTYPACCLAKDPFPAARHCREQGSLAPEARTCCLLEPAQFEIFPLDGAGLLGTRRDLFCRDPHAGQQITGQGAHPVGPYEDVAAGRLGLAGGIVEFVLRVQHVQQAARPQQELVMVGLPRIRYCFPRPWYRTCTVPWPPDSCSRWIPCPDAGYPYSRTGSAGPRVPAPMRHGCQPRRRRC